MRIVVVTPIPTPYRDRLWNAVADLPGIDLHVLYCAAGKDDRPWARTWEQRFHAEILPGKNLTRWRGPASSCYWNPSLASRLKEIRPDAIVVGGYNHPTMLSAIWYARRHKIPDYQMCESHLKKQRSAWRKKLKDLVLRRIFGRAAGSFPTGRLASEYVAYYGTVPDRMCCLPNAPDVEHFARMSEELRPKRDEIRRNARLDNGPAILFAGRLIPLKQADTLLRAVAQLPKEQGVQLVIVGDGPERKSLERLAAELEIDSRTRFIGFVQPDELPRWYAAADLFVLPSSETWGVVVFEALASGLPVIVSDEVGCHPDAINDPVVGGVFKARNAAALTQALATRLAANISREDVVRHWSPVRESLQYSQLAKSFVEHLASTGRLSLSGNESVTKPVVEVADSWKNSAGEKPIVRDKTL